MELKRTFPLSLVLVLPLFSTGSAEVIDSNIFIQPNIIVIMTDDQPKGQLKEELTKLKTCAGNADAALNSATCWR